MAFKVQLTPRAEQDIQEAYLYILERSPEAAIRWGANLRQKIEGLEVSHLSSTPVPESQALGFELRQIHFGSKQSAYRIIFRQITETEIHVVSIRHGSRDVLEPKDLD